MKFKRASVRRGLSLSLYKYNHHSSSWHEIMTLLSNVFGIYLFLSNTNTRLNDSYMQNNQIMCVIWFWFRWQHIRNQMTLIAYKEFRVNICINNQNCLSIIYSRARKLPKSLLMVCWNIFAQRIIIRQCNNIKHCETDTLELSLQSIWNG